MPYAAAAAFVSSPSAAGFHGRISKLERAEALLVNFPLNMLGNTSREDDGHDLLTTAIINSRVPANSPFILSLQTPSSLNSNPVLLFNPAGFYSAASSTA